MLKFNGIFQNNSKLNALFNALLADSAVVFRSERGKIGAPVGARGEPLEWT